MNKLRTVDTRVRYTVVVQATPVEREAAYYAALKLVALIDEDLTRGVCCYRNKAGELLTKLDQVIRAILENDLAGVA